MLNATAITGLQQSIEDADAALAALAEDLKNKRFEVRRYRKALAVLTGQAPKTRRSRRAPLENNVPGPDPAPELN
jgi:outer membrane protein TolC